MSNLKIKAVDPKLMDLVKACEEYVEHKEKKEPGDPSVQWVFEKAMEFVYGREIWDYMRKIDA